MTQETSKKVFAYLDCIGGISGDMMLGAFIDLGVPVEWLQESLRGIPLTGFDLKISSVNKGSIQATQVQVETYPQKHARNYFEIRELIEASSLSSTVKKISLGAFHKIAAAEAEIHGIAIDQVHLHEVGAVDAIVDIVGAALCVEYLQIEEITASKLPMGRGFVNCQHGQLPVPAPATLSILKGVPVYGVDIDFETVTPTGAALAAMLAETFSTLPDMTIEKIGYGAGMRDFDAIPNVLRIVLGTSPVPRFDLTKNCRTDTIALIETDVDDMNPELFGFVMERLFEGGALDVSWTPVFMKKNRPGTQIQVLCPPERQDEIIACLLTETTSTGVRHSIAQRVKLLRSVKKLESSFGLIAVKQIRALSGEIRMVPEFDACRKIALEKNIPLRVIYETIVHEARLSLSRQKDEEKK